MANPSMPPTTSEQPDEIPALAGRLGIDLPPECVAGVLHHSRLLDEHWANLRGFGRPRT